ncbi:MAG: hypothetical protein NT169_24185 [Chloroflexi bacterium]|nr:hypothetical protein [Chloroflexota bacterium]
MGKRSHRSLFKPMYALALIATALIAAACAPATPPAPAIIQVPTGVVATAAPAAVTTTPVSEPGKKLDLPVGMDADGNFYRGDPKAPVKLIEFSDFQ